MVRRSIALIFLGAAAVSAAFTQTPAPGAKGEARVFSFFTDDSGGYLGVQTAEVTKENFSKYGLRDVRGVAIEKVVNGSPAQTAGLQDGDVIVRFNGDEVTSVRKLTRLVGDVAADHQAKLIVLRNGDEREINVTLGKRPTPRFEDGAFSVAVPGRAGRIQLPSLAPIPGSPDMPALPPMSELPRIAIAPPAGAEGDVFMYRSFSGRRIGVGITPLTKQLAEHFGVTGGVMVNFVRENSAAAKAGLQAGDIIVEVEGKELKGDLDLIRAIGEKKDGDVQLTILRDGNRQTIRVTPEEVKGGYRTFDMPEGGMIAPGGVRSMTPSTPASPLSPMPLNQMSFPGRIL